MRIRSASQAGKTAVFELRKLSSDLSSQNLVQNRNQRLCRLIVGRVNIGRRDCVGSSVPVSKEAGHSVLVEDVQDVKVEGQRITSILPTKPVMVRPGKIRLREGRSSSHIASLD